MQSLQCEMMDSGFKQREAGVRQSAHEFPTRGCLIAGSHIRAEVDDQRQPNKRVGSFLMEPSQIVFFLHKTTPRKYIMNFARRWTLWNHYVQYYAHGLLPRKAAFGTLPLEFSLSGVGP